MSAPVPYWRLSSFYLFYFATLGALVPYWAVYLKSLGFDAIEIGQLMAMLMATKIIGPNIWGWIADRSRHRMSIVRLAAFMGAVVFSAVFYVEGYAQVALMMIGFSFFWHAALPQFEATTMNHLGDEHHRYAKIRLWGSVGFIVTVMGVGELFDRFGSMALPPVVFVLLLGIWLTSLLAPDSKDAPHVADSGSLLKVLKRPEVFSLLLMSFLLQASHGPYYTFFSIYLNKLGYSNHLIGGLWALGVVAEIVLFLSMPRLLRGLGARNLLIGALLLACLRWLMLANLAGSLLALLFIQLLHAASFGVIHAVSIHLTHRYFKGQHQGRGQALYSSLSFGAGGAVGNLAGGYLWEGFGPVGTYSLAAAAAFVAMLVTWRWAERGTVSD